MNRPIRVLLIEDIEDDALLIVNELKNGGFDPTFTRVESLPGLQKALAEHEWDCVISDYSMPHFSGLAALAEVQSGHEDIPFILVSGTIGEELAVTAMKWGAHDYIMKDKLGRLVPAIERELKEAEAHREQKRTNEALKEIEQRFRKSFESAPNGMALVALDGRWLQVNLALCQILGYSEKELLALTIQNITHPDDLGADLENVHKIVSGEIQSYHIEKRYIHKQGHSLWVQLFVSLVRDAEDKPSYFIAQILDVTARKRGQEALSDSERRFHQLFDDAPVGYHELDTQGRIIEVNRTELVMLGYKADEMLHHPVWEFIVEGENAREAMVAKIAGSQRSDQAYERTFRKRDGGTLNVIVQDRVLRNDAGEVIGIRSTVQDITERKHADRDFRLMAQTVASARDCISISDLQNRLLFVNDAFRNTYGYTTEELLGKDIAILRPPGTPQAITDRILRDTLDKGWHGELLNRRKDGSEFPVELWTSVVKDEGGVPVAMVGVARNITDRNLAQEHLRQSEEQFRLIAENLADMVAVLDLNGRRIYNSPSYQSILGDPELLKGTDGFREIHPDDVARIKNVFDETVKTGVGQRLEYRLIGNDGSTRDIESKGSVIRDKDGKISKVVVVSRDVTEEKKLASQFLRAQRMESIGTLAGGIAHDLNNVLAPIMMAIEVLRSKIPDPGGQRILQTIETSAKRGSDIVRQVLAFGRGMKGERILVQLKHVVNEVVRIAGETFPKSIEIKTDIPRDLWTVSADPTQMHQVILNLLVNARDAMPRGGTLSLSAVNIKLDENYSRMHLGATPGAYVSITVADTGTGIPANIRDKIFDPFFTTKDIGKGTGLGLSTTLAIVKSHGGFINLESHVEKGTTFSIFIPATGLPSGLTAPNVEADLPMGNGELILIIDDEAAVREITKETLQAYGYKALTANDGAEGIAVFAENKKRINAVITDIMMPVMDGTAAIMALRRIDPAVKIIAASGLTTRGQIAPSRNSNVKALLTKPYTAEALLKTLASALK